MECIDVFSGIGGISRALSPFVKPLIYCEWDGYCQQVLAARMRDGSIDKAPIHSDIRNLYIPTYMAPKMIVGGFPCQDISVAGNKLGMAGERSSLFYEIVRLIDESPSIRHVFLENVANIVKCGFAEVIEELTARGFRMVWTTRSAASLGAPHQRSRWFCLATRSAPGSTEGEGDTIDIKIPSLNENTLLTKDPWAVECTPRITRKGDDADPTWDPNWIARSQCLGNTVVPCVVRSAFLELVGINNNLALISSAMSPYAVNSSTLSYPYPETGIISTSLNLDADQTKSSQSMYIPLPTHRQGNGGCKVDVTVVLASGKEIKMLNYPTPRRGITHPSTLTDRSMHDLPTVLVNSTVARSDILASFGEIPEKLIGVVVPNVNYIEWMMGYPPNWTRIPANGSKTSFKSCGERGEREGTESSMCTDALVCTPPQMQRPKQKRALNGMHVFMRENPGKDVVQVAKLWRELTDDEKVQYRVRAAQL